MEHKNDRVSPSRLCQIEIHVADMERALNFYELVFGWRRAPADLHEYVVLDVPEGCPYGISLLPGRSLESGESQPKLILYFACDEPEGIVQLAKQHGGRHCFGPKALPGFGRIYQIEDPDGHRYGLYQERKVLKAQP